MKQDNILSMLSIAAKARKVVSGESQTEQAIKANKAYLVVVAEDASENTKKLFRDKCKFYETAIVFYGNRESLGRCIGKTFRASLAIVDEGLAQAVQKKLAQQTTE